MVIIWYTTSLSVFLQYNASSMGGGWGREEEKLWMFHSLLREGSENCQARSRCSKIIWIIGSQPVWERSTEAMVQFPDPLPPAPHPQPHLPRVIGYQERKDAEHPQVCCTQNNLYRTMYLLPGRLLGRESWRLRPGRGAWEQPLSWPANGKRASLGGWGGSTPHSRPTQGFLSVCSARGERGRVGRKSQRAGLPLASADSFLLSRCFHFFSLAFARGFQSRDLTFATYSHCDHRYGMTLLWVCFAGPQRGS